jgi:methylated-DNA-[protein]-cysteine S-methyltransferase
MTLVYDQIATPIGLVTVVATAEGIGALEIDRQPAEIGRLLEARFGAVELVPSVNPHGACDRLRAYFGGDLRAIDGVPVDPGGTAFQRRVWGELRRIPAGETRSYRDVARAIGHPSAMRAVGAANGRNPVGIIVPCHRVIGADGALVGYAGGLERKRWLLRHEGAPAARRPAAASLELAFPQV